jgi:hypothetical protein
LLEDFGKRGTFRHRLLCHVVAQLLVVVWRQVPHNSDVLGCHENSGLGCLFKLNPHYFSEIEANRLVDNSLRALAGRAEYAVGVP